MGVGTPVQVTRQQTEVSPPVKNFTLPLELLRTIREFATNLSFEVEFAYEPLTNTVRISPGNKNTVDAPALHGNIVNIHTHPSHVIYQQAQLKYHPPTGADYVSVLWDSLRNPGFRPVSNVVVEPSGVWVYRSTLGLILYLLDVEPDLPLLIKYHKEIPKSILKIDTIIRENMDILGHQLAAPGKAERYALFDPSADIVQRISLSQYLNEAQHYLLHPAQEEEGKQWNDGFFVEYYPFSQLDSDVMIPNWKTTTSEKDECKNPGFPTREFIDTAPLLIKSWSTLSATNPVVNRNFWTPVCSAPTRRHSVFSLLPPITSQRRRRRSLAL
jgi:hypothetical protein